MIHKTNKHILYYLYTISFITVNTHNTALSTTISTQIGNNITLTDVLPQTGKPFSERWYFEYECSTTHSNNKLHNELCEINYLMNDIRYTLTDKEKPVNYTCNKKTLYLYNISRKTPKSYTLKKVNLGLQQTISHYCLNITSVTSEQYLETTKATQRNTHSPALHSNNLTATFSKHLLYGNISRSATTTSLTTTGAIGTVSAGFGYLYYHYRHKRTP
ncbi:membrane protein RL11B [Cercopithecine betaherpesvirus 5]|uniref:Membrane protein RL11B n=1 Tax=Simian cytomegalovirus (strain Colburn) TaxID=50292 RepID=G8XTP7_SCMVC|nr:membrane protein RL11B [Cercopithecine betaherpesvirus 5]